MSSPYGLEFVESCLGCKLAGKDFFCFLSEPALAAFEKCKFTNVLPKNSRLFIAGQKAIGIHVLCIGKVKLWTKGANGRAVIVKIAVPGDVLGLHACVAGTPHELTAETVQPSQVVFVRREDFLELLKQDREVCWRTAQVLSRHCHEGHEFIRALGLGHSASEKLARFMLDISGSGQATDNNHANHVRVDMALTHQEIAQAIGMSRETVWRKLCEFRRNGVAQVEGSTLLIQDRAALKRLAGR